MNRICLIALPALVVLVSGCSMFGLFKSSDYKTAQPRAAQPLEVPPELTSPTMDDRYSIPDPRTQTTYSAYSQRPATTGTPAGAAAAGGPAVLPRFDNVKFERHQDQRWLVVKGDPEKVWPVVREFWIDSGYQLLRESPELGLMETDWYEDRSKIPQDIVRRTVGRVLEGLWSFPRRDKFRTRLEKGVEPGTTEIFVSNRNVEEVMMSTTSDRTIWQSQPADRDLEAEMLSRIMAKLGGGDTKVTTASAPLPGRRGVVPPAPSANEPRNAVLDASGLTVNDSFDRAWRRVGLALDRVGFTVEDRDRSKGLFFVRYIDPEADRQNTKTDEGWLDKLKFWKSTPKVSSQPQYRIHVADAGASMSQVQVQDVKGGTEASATGKRILTLLYDQLK
ncbi:MAG TPA: outer membrane protein assembly factor BamC [Usitatibacter sp.]|nr:outer membrane protein assembly factor BamC [Usitatibacter sp.]